MLVSRFNRYYAQSMIIEKQSTILYHVLDKIGVTGAVREWMRDAASTISEICDFASFIGTETTYNPPVVVGSLSEGTYRMSYKSDVDILHFLNRIYSYEIESSATGKNYCIFEYIDSKPGYVYLNVHGTTTGPGITIKVLPTRKKLLQRHNEKNHTFLTNGPANTVAISGRIDIVPCVHIPWPSVANEWFNRKRPYNWPSEETQQKLRDLPCIVVQAAHTDTPEHEKDIEWRLSFTLQENHLIHNLNDTQYKCYVLLKMVKHDLITAKFGESLTSYHCKTALLFTMEQFPESIWRPENLIQCLVLCLLRLCSWTLVEFCPHYFMSTVDLFLGKVDKQIMPKICTTLQTILKNPVESLKKLTCSNCGTILQIELSGVKCGPELTMTEAIAKQEFINTVVKICQYPRITFSAMQAIFYKLNRNIYDRHNIDLLSLMKYCLDKTESDKRKHYFLHHMLQTLYALIASILVAWAFRSDNHIVRDWLFGAAALNFMYALDDNNNIVARLRLANVLYATGHRERAASILDKVQNIIETYRTPSMTQEESKTMTMSGRFERFLQEKGQSDIDAIFSTPMYTMLNMFPDIDIAFDINEIEIVPKCFVFELFKNIGTALPLSFKNPHKFDAINYYMYLTYLVKRNCENLKNCLKNCFLNEDISVAFYVLGWRERERGHYLRAAQFFYQSWKEHEEVFRYPYPEYVMQWRPICAAKLHLLVLMYEIWRGRKELLPST